MIGVLESTRRSRLFSGLQWSSLGSCKFCPFAVLTPVSFDSVSRMGRASAERSNRCRIHRSWDTWTRRRSYRCNHRWLTHGELHDWNPLTCRVCWLAGPMG